MSDRLNHLTPSQRLHFQPSGDCRWHAVLTSDTGFKKWPTIGSIVWTDRFAVECHHGSLKIGWGEPIERGSAKANVPIKEATRTTTMSSLLVIVVTTSYIGPYFKQSTLSTGLPASFGRAETR